MTLTLLKTIIVKWAVSVESLIHAIIPQLRLLYLTANQKNDEPQHVEEMSS
jgi:hypothetical protein